MGSGAMVRIGIAGAPGRMGRAVAAAAEGRSDVRIAARFHRGAVTPRGESGALTSYEQAMADCDVIVDFSSATASARLATLAAQAGGPALVIGSTGFTAPERAELARAGACIAIVQSGNFAIGVNVLAGLVAQTARRLGPDLWDIEVLEAHHRGKADAPSGTALLLAEAAARGRGHRLEELRAPAREGVSLTRAAGSIGIAVSRAGGLIGEHAVVFAADDEILTLSHSARDRGLFARGALEAAVWVATRAPGLYAMSEVLGFKE